MERSLRVVLMTPRHLLLTWTPLHKGFLRVEGEEEEGKDRCTCGNPSQ